MNKCKYKYKTTTYSNQHKRLRLFAILIGGNSEKRLGEGLPMSIVDKTNVDVKCVEFS
jgi:hypothetical protein